MSLALSSGIVLDLQKLEKWIFCQKRARCEASSAFPGRLGKVCQQLKLKPVVTSKLHHLALNMASAKRSLESEDSHELLKKFKSDDTKNNLQHFLEWCKNGKLILSEKVQFGNKPNGKWVRPQCIIAQVAQIRLKFGRAAEWGEGHKSLESCVWHHPHCHCHWQTLSTLPPPNAPKEKPPPQQHFVPILHWPPETPPPLALSVLGDIINVPFTWNKAWRKSPFRSRGIWSSNPTPWVFQYTHTDTALHPILVGILSRTGRCL